MRDILNGDGTAEPDLEESIRLMRHLYKNRREGERKGALARNYVETKLSPHIIAKQIVLKLQDVPFSALVTIAWYYQTPYGYTLRLPYI